MIVFSELIYTRCRQGIDLLKPGKTISGDGFKVYSCTPVLMEDGNADLPFLLDAAQKKQPYDASVFMDDAYLYFVPDKGNRFMVEFHPVPYDPDAKGDYSHRPGNFVNQIIAGDFSGFYPFELFRDSAVWNAKGRGEAYYYENQPSPLPARDVDDPAGQINIDDIAAFISDGRKEAFMTTVSFLISQYEQPPENRKFLVIRDESSEKIELWIAAIELAFSPRMASAIPFATRMDKFADANRYTVNQMGVYQTQINLQDPNQKQRYRAMIAGVDERDRANTAAARPLANSPFVLLDGKEKRAAFEADTSHHYYRLITLFDHTHQTFCREFLQMLDIAAPGPEIYRLFDCFTALEDAASLPNAQALEKILSVLDKYGVFNSPTLKNLYNRIKTELKRFLHDNLNSALRILKWLQTVAKVIGDNDASRQLTGIVCKEFAEHVFSEPDAGRIFSFWKNIRNSEFASAVAGYLVEPSTLQNYNTHVRRFTAPDGITFVLIYLECAAFLGSVSAQNIKKIVGYGMKFCSCENDTNSAHKILKALSQNRQIPAQAILLSIAKEANRDYAEFIVKSLIGTDESIAASDASMLAFSEKLSAEGLEYLFVSVLKHRIHALSGPADIEPFINLVMKFHPLSSRDLAEVFEKLDGRLLITEKGGASAACALQKAKPKEAVCPNSAHLYALELLNNSHMRPRFTSIYEELITQGFPSADNPDYIQALTERLFKVQMNKNELEYIIRLFARVPSYIAELVSTILGMTKQKRNKEWCILIDVAVKTDGRTIDDAVIDACVKLKHGEKALTWLSDLLVSKEARDYFMHIADESKEKIRTRKPRSGFGKFFKVFSGDDSDAR
ncbi:MAG: hypothetical protein LBU28_02475 [Spirochaetaceae bacterium]|jgi:hypothetical protein|nr:hypothetical protein [Spirochaetaceae bacterium]